jgi:hypothetical protein
MMVASTLINLAELNARIYFLQVKSETGIGTKQLVVHLSLSLFYNHLQFVIG